MKIYVIDPNTKLVAVYYNKGKTPHLFRIRIDVTLFGLKDQLDQINCQLNHRDTRRVDGVDYWRPSTDSARIVQFSRMKLENDDDMRTVFSIFGQYSTKEPIELDASLVRSVEQIQKSLIWPRNYEEIRALLDAPYEDINLVDLWFVMFYFITCFMLLNSIYIYLGEIISLCFQHSIYC